MVSGNLDLMVFANVQKVVVVEKIPSENSFQVIGEFIAADLTHTPTVSDIHKNFLKT